MKKIIIAIILVIFVAAGFPIFGQAKKAAAKSDNAWALIFNLQPDPLSVLAYNDGGAQAGNQPDWNSGFGLKYWLFTSLALRAQLMFHMESSTATEETTTTMGIGGAAEFHPLTGKVSPYFGGLIGVESVPIAEGTAINFYIGGIFGAEAKLLDYLSFYAEYSLLAIFTQDGYVVNLGTGNNGQIGLLFYFM